MHTKTSSIEPPSQGDHRCLAAVLIVALLALAAFAAAAPTAGAAAPDFLFRAPAGGAPGSGAGELGNPRGIATDPISGHLYVSELENARISEFTAWGEFVKAWGWDVAPEGAPGDTVADQLEVCSTACKAGVKGDGAGQLGGAFGITHDGNGDLYVAESPSGGQGSLRVQKFDPDGNFLLMVGGEVNKTTGANLCTKADLEGGDTCGAAVSGTGPGEFSNNTVGNHIAYSPTADAILVGDNDRIQVFNLDGSFLEEIPFEGELAPFSDKSVSALTVDSVGDIYLIISGLEDLYKLSATGEPLDPGKPGDSKFTVADPQGSIAVDGGGHVFAVDDPIQEQISDQARVLEFDPAGNRLLPTKEEEEEAEEDVRAPFPHLESHGPRLNGLATNICPGSEAPGSLYLTAFREGFGIGDTWSYLEAYGTAPVGCEPPPKRPPLIAAQYASAVGSKEATLKAEINPRFWTDTTYYLQYGTGKCSEGGCTTQKPLPPGAVLTSKALNEPLRTAGVFLTDLQPGTTYHYRFASQSSGSEGETVLGVGGEPGVEGEEGTFRTFPAPTPPPACPGNEALRTGFVAKLPDCRGYELVSPLEKEGADAGSLPSVYSFFEVNQSALSGDRFTYSSMGAFGGASSAPFVSQYLANRDPEAGWSTEAISPPRSVRPLDTLFSLNNEFKAFSADLCQAWLRHNSVSTLSAGAIAGYANLYRRESCGAGPSYEALSTAEPLNSPATEYDQNIMGFSADGAKAIFNATAALTPDAPLLAGKGDDPSERVLLYYQGAEGLRFVCRLPNGNPITTRCGAGLPAGSQSAGNASGLQGAISADGSRVFWTAFSVGLQTAPVGVPGKIYLRQNPGQEQSKVSAGQCKELEKACTVEVSGTVTSEPASFWGAAKDGSKAIFAVEAGPKKGNLYEFDVETRTPRLIAEGTLGPKGMPMGMSEDASRIYFASSKDLAAGASEGARNLYLYEAPTTEGGEGSFSFIMGLTSRDLLGTELLPGPISDVPTVRSATVSADGLHAAFTSFASPTPSGYDNLDAVSGEADQEAYLYAAQANELRCVSCNPTEARPTGVNIGTSGTPAWMAARLPRPKGPLIPPHPLAADGSRLFFESHEALVPGDANGTWDVYQWEAPGTGSCTEASSTYGEAAAGCVDLISSGQSPSPSRFLDADPNGDNAFIATQASLIPADFGLGDVYDVRVGGGFPEAPPPPAGCEGEACQGPLSAPDDPTPASSSFNGAGNAKEGVKSSCRKPKVRRKGRCVAKQHRRAKKAKHNRRAGR